MSLMTISEAATMFKISREFLYRHTRSGQLPHYRCGSEIRLDLSELREFFKCPARMNGA